MIENDHNIEIDLGRPQQQVGGKKIWTYVQVLPEETFSFIYQTHHVGLHFGDFHLFQGNQSCC